MARHTSVEYIRFTTDGTAARKVEAVAPIKTMRLPRAKKQTCKTVRIDPLALAAIVVTAAIALCMVIGLLRWNAIRQETVALEAHVERLQAERTDLENFFKENCNLDKIERRAMAMGMVPKDQVTCVTIQVPPETVEKQPNAWERFTTFLTGLFA